jgi:hypothetical protein
MAATYNTVTIGPTEYEVYSDIPTADQFLAADASAAGTAWRAQADDTVKARDLVTATRILDRQRWPGTKTDENQERAFPRDDMGSDCATDGVIPQDLIDACSLLAAYIEAGVDVNGTLSEQTSIKRQAAGSVSIEYFRQFDIARFPLPVQELLNCLLAGSASVGGVISNGTDECSDFEHSYSPNGSL